MVRDRLYHDLYHPQPLVSIAVHTCPQLYSCMCDGVGEGRGETKLSRQGSGRGRPDIEREIIALPRVAKNI